MDHEGNKNSDRNTSSEQGGGIFSTPDLSVNTENLPNAEAALSEDNKSRIAAAFRGTEASQKQTQAREMNEAALARSDIPSTATGDIKLPGEKKKHKKAPLIIVAILALLAVGGGVVWLIGNLSMPTKQTVIQTFMHYVDYMEDGPENESHDLVKPALLHMEENGYTSNEQEQFTKNARQLFQDFRTMFDKSNLSLDANFKQAMDNKLNQYSELLDFIIVYNNLYINNAALLGVYISNGRDAAIQSITQMLPKYEYNEQLQYPIEKISDYWHKNIAIYDLYSQYGCIDGATLDMGCASAIFDPELRQLSSYNEMIIDGISLYYNLAIRNFQAATKEIKASLEAIDE